MVMQPVFRGGEPLWIERGGVLVPAWADDPCDPDCCPQECICLDDTGNQAVCTSGWARGGYRATNCNPLHVVLTDKSTPPPGYCYTRSIWQTGLGTHVSTTREFDFGDTLVSCFPVTLTSVSHCCTDPSCGCSDSVDYEISPDFCCCFGGECVNGSGTYDFPESVALTIHEVTYNCPKLNGIFPGTVILPKVNPDNDNSGLYELSPVPGLGIGAELGCEGLFAAGVQVIGCSSSCQFEEISLQAGDATGPCQNPVEDLERRSFCGGFFGVFKGITVQW